MVSLPPEQSEGSGQYIYSLLLYNINVHKLREDIRWVVLLSCVCGDMVHVVGNRLLSYNTHLKNEEKSPPTGQS